MRGKTVGRGDASLLPSNWFVILNSCLHDRLSDQATKVAGLCGVNQSCNTFFGTVINLLVDCKSCFQPLSLSTSPLLLSSPNFLEQSRNRTQVHVIFLHLMQQRLSANDLPYRTQDAQHSSPGQSGTEATSQLKQSMPLPLLLYVKDIKPIGIVKQ